MKLQGFENGFTVVPTVMLPARITDAAEMPLVSFTGGTITLASITKSTVDAILGQGLSKGAPANSVLTSRKLPERFPNGGGDGVEGLRSPGCGAGGAGSSCGSGRRAVDKSNVMPLCAGCHKLLTAADLQPLPPPLCSQKQQQQQAKGPESPPVLDCFACHRCFHARCHRVWVAQQQQQRPDPQQKQQASQRKGAQSGGNGSRQQVQLGRDDSGGNGADPDMWFHSDECRQVHRALQHLCWAGDIPCEQPMGRTSAAPIGGNAAESDDIHLVMRLYDCRNLGLATSAGLRRAHSVLRQEFGYSLTDLRQFDFAALLTRGATPVSAAILDVYGADVAELCLMATRTAMQRCGYGTALLRQLSTELGGAGVRRLLVSVDDDDKGNQVLWNNKFGFKFVSRSELSGLGLNFGAFNAPAAEGTAFLARTLL
ncbi:hypothetical protein Vretifemale_4514 [Volvox reticuliferus]|uniref:N-acetyltransferase domain-containing protein n=1 Tax=Volvox reticuliferus TaxID=1737510 RepID=A0A8J4C4F3_9CHLO|nr:hypothetical protein Vretifemale_4514 [Volvox reticuliferus]